MTDPTTKKWLDDFATELRLRNVRGTAIGDALAGVESHCAETGETPAEAFGDPREFARALEFPPADIVSSSSGTWARVVAISASGLVSMSMAPALVEALFAGRSVTVTWGALAALAILGAHVFAGVSLMPTLLAKRWVMAAFFAVGITGYVTVGYLWRAPAIEVPVWLYSLTLLALLAGATWGQRRLRQQSADPIVDPRQPGRAGTPPLNAATDWIFVVVTVANAAITAVPLAFKAWGG